MRTTGSIGVADGLLPFDFYSQDIYNLKLASTVTSNLDLHRCNKTDTTSPDQNYTVLGEKTIETLLSPVISQNMCHNHNNPFEIAPVLCILDSSLSLQDSKMYANIATDNVDDTQHHVTDLNINDHNVGPIYNIQQQLQSEDAIYNCDYYDRITTTPAANPKENPKEKSHLHETLIFDYAEKTSNNNNRFSLNHNNYKPAATELTALNSHLHLNLNSITKFKPSSPIIIRDGFDHDDDYSSLQDSSYYSDLTNSPCTMISNPVKWSNTIMIAENFGNNFNKSNNVITNTSSSTTTTSKRSSSSSSNINISINIKESDHEISKRLQLQLPLNSNLKNEEKPYDSSSISSSIFVKTNVKDSFYLKSKAHLNISKVSIITNSTLINDDISLNKNKIIFHENSNTNLNDYNDNDQTIYNEDLIDKNIINRTSSITNKVKKISKDIQIDSIKSLRKRQLTSNLKQLLSPYNWFKRD